MEKLAIREKIKIESHEPIMKRVLFLIAFEGFRDQEYFVPKEILEKRGIKIKTVSTKKGIAIGADGGDTNIDLILEEVNVGDFDAIVFVGGPGCLEYLDNEKSYRVAREALQENKILAAICISPIILAKAGVLKGKKATVWASALDRGPIQVLEEKGAEFIDEKLVQNGNIITANGPVVAEEFGKKILEKLD